MRQFFVENKLAFTLVVLLSAAFLYKNSQGVVPATAEVVPVAPVVESVPLASNLATDLESNDFASEARQDSGPDLAAATLDPESALAQYLDLSLKASDGERQPLTAFLSQLDGTPELARQMIRDGLARTAKSSDTAIERTGFLELVPRFSAGHEKWAAETLEKELIENPSAPRLSKTLAKTRSEKEQATAITPDILRTQIAYETLATVLKSDCISLEQATAKIAMEQKDEMLLRGFETRLRSQCPLSQVSSNLTN